MATVEQVVMDSQMRDLTSKTAADGLEISEGKTNISELTPQLLLIGNASPLAGRMNNQVNLRVLGNPKGFNGLQDVRANWRFQFESFCGACNQDQAHMVVQATQREGPIPMPTEKKGLMLCSTLYTCL